MNDKNKIVFYKLNVLGNDYILIDCINDNSFESLPGWLITQMSNRRTGIGADDIILLQESDKADYKIRIMNPDGSEAPMCGNALICTANYIYYMNYQNQMQFKIETKTGIKTVYKTTDENIRVCIGKASINKSKLYRKIQINDKQIELMHLNTGAPHAIIYVKDLKAYPVEEVGSIVEKHEIFDETTNVMFVECEQENQLNMRCWERGGTGESLACGTGACAAVYATFINKKCKEKTAVEFTYGKVSVEIADDHNLYIIATSKIIYRGEYFTSPD